MSHLPPNPDPADRDPRDDRLRQRSDAPTLSPLLIIFGILLLCAVVYVASALL